MSHNRSFGTTDRHQAHTIRHLSVFSSAPQYHVVPRAEVEERTTCHGRLVQDPVEHLQLGDTLSSPVLVKPGLLYEQRQAVLVRLRHPSVAIADEAHEEGARAVDLGKTYGQDFAPFGLFGRNAPAQVDVDHFDVTLTRTPPELWKDLANQQVAFLGKIAKSGAEKDSNRAGGGHAFRQSNPL